ncbi:MAG TPA: hypothetical protein VGK45_16835, partial [Thermoanaerobaculia bacterium]|jgi:flagellar biosynthesis/type III secretory pathway protein FliH
MSRAEHKMACLRRIATAGLNELHSFLLGNCVETYLQCEGRDADELAALQARDNAKEVRAMRLTWADQLRKEGQEQGRAQGREQGFQETLLHQLGARFGPLSDDVRQRVEGIHSVKRLQEIAEQVLVAHSLEEMGLR